MAAKPDPTGARDGSHMNSSLQSLLLTTAMNEDTEKTERSLADVKSDLINLASSAETINPSFLSLHREIFTSLAQPSNDPTKANIQAADALLIWYLRAIQSIKAGNEWSKCNFEGIAHSKVFEWATSSLEFSHGAQANAGLGLLKRMVQFICLHECGIQLCSQWALQLYTGCHNKKERFQMLETVVKECPEVAECIKKNDPQFVKNILLSLRTGAVANASSKCLVALLQNLHLKFLSEEDFVAFWATEVIQAMAFSDLQRKNIHQYFLPLAFRITPNCLKIFVTSYLKDHDEDRLTVLLMNQKMFKSKDPIETGIISELEVMDALLADKERVRLLALDLVVSCIRTSTVPGEHILNLLKNKDALDGFVEDTRSPETRDAFCSTLRKAVISLKNCYVHNITKSPESIKLTLTFLQDYFFQWVNPSSSYLPLFIALSFFELLVEEEFDGISRQKQKNKRVMTILEIYNEPFISVLLRFLTNNYEDIRMKSRKLLQRAPEFAFLEVQSDLISQYYNNAFESLKSVKGRKSDENVNLLLFLMSKESSDFSQINKYLSHPQLNLNNLANSSPHGVYAFHSKFINEFSILISSQKLYFGDLFRQLMGSCEQLWSKYKANTTFNTLEDSEGMEATSWRPIRESAILLASIIEADRKNNYELLDDESLLQACDLIIDQLSNITHRGVFMAVYDAYVKACCACLERPIMMHYPLDWLEKSLDIIKSKTQFVSRRSGGLPFLITGVLNGLYKKKLYQDKLREVFTKLAAFTQIPLREEDRSTSGFPQVHSFNCIKQMFLDSLLFPQSKRYIYEAFCLALDSIDSPEWSIKNAALMLFSSLVNRLFGTNMVGNLLTGMKTTVFFAMYRGIEERCLDRLSTSKSKSIESLICILTILERLDWNGNNNSAAVKFKTLLDEHCLGHKQWKIRQLAARVLAKMTAPSKAEEFAAACLMSVRACNSYNLVHGKLLLVLNLQKRGVKIPSHSLVYAMKSPALACHQIVNALLDIIDTHEYLQGEIILSLEILYHDYLRRKKRYPDNTRDECLIRVTKLIFKGNDESLKSLFECLIAADFYKSLEAALDICKQMDNLPVDVIKTLKENASDPKTWNPLRVEIMKLLISKGIYIKTPLPDSEWSKELQVLSFVAQDKLDIQKLKPLLHVSQPEETRLLCVDAMSRALEKASNDDPYCDDIFVLLLLTSRSESREVRRKAADALAKHCGLPSTWSTPYTFRMALKLKSPFQLRDSSVLYDYLALFRQNFRDFEKKDLLDLDRDDLYMNEMRVYVELANAVNGSIDIDIDKVLSLIDNKGILRSWEYDYLFHTGLSKVMTTASEEDRIRIRQGLAKIGYIETPVSS